MAENTAFLDKRYKKFLLVVSVLGAPESKIEAPKKVFVQCRHSTWTHVHMSFLAVVLTVMSIDKKG